MLETVKAGAIMPTTRFAKLRRSLEALSSSATRVSSKVSIGASSSSEMALPENNSFAAELVSCRRVSAKNRSDGYRDSPRADPRHPRCCHHTFAGSNKTARPLHLAQLLLASCSVTSISDDEQDDIACLPSEGNQ